MDLATGSERGSSRFWDTTLSLLMILAGVLAIATPLIAGLAVTGMVSALLLLSGILHAGFAWNGGKARHVIWEILISLAYVGIAVYILVQPVAGLASLTLALAAYLLVEAVLEIVLFFERRHAQGAGWLLFDGIITFILAAMIWSTWPSNSAWVLGLLVGISMIFSGITRLMLSGTPGPSADTLNAAT